jgi:hypothetical protein
MQTLQSRFDALIEEQRALKAKFQTEAQAMFKDTMKEFFDKNPGITALKWTQYTPYFNDGDPCVFNVNDVTFTNATEDELDNVTAWGEYEGEDESVWVSQNIAYVLNSGSKYYQEEAAKIRAAGGFDEDSCDLIDKVIRSDEMEDIMKEMFGDHVVITATRDGFDVDDYEHD